MHHALAHVVTQPELFPRNDRLEKRLRATCSAICLEPLRELGPRLLYEGTKPGPAGNGSLLLTPLELLDRLAPLARPPRLHRHTATATSAYSRERPLTGNFQNNR